MVPPGEATWSLSTPGCRPVSRTILAAPSTVWAASRLATSRGKPGTHAAVGEGLDHQVDKRRAAAREARDGVEHRLGHPDRLAHRAQEVLDQGLVLGPSPVAERKGRDPLADQCRRVGHDPDDPRVPPQPLDDRLDRDPRRDRDDQMLGSHRRRSSASTWLMLCGFTARTRTSLCFTTSILDSKTAMPVSAWIALRAAASGSLAKIESAVAIPRGASPGPARSPSCPRR